MLRFIMLLALLLPGCATVREESAATPIVIAHRGASGERPEHTLDAYALAIEQGADFIEPDLVITRDGVLVARHENEIGSTTDVAARPEFADRRATRTIDGESVTGWFAEDFTLAELRTLRARERLPQLRSASAAFDGRFAIPTLREVIALAQRRARETGRTIGIYPELKHPSYLRGIGLPMEERLVAELAAAGWTTRAAPVFVQCFEVGPLQRLRRRTGVRLVQLLSDSGGPFDRPELTYRAMATPAGLADIAAYADGVGPAKALIVPRDAAGRSLPATRFIADAHAAGLLVHPWTFRSENLFLPAELRRGADPAVHGDAAAELASFLALGVDGLFADFPAAAVRARAAVARTRD